MKHIGIVACSAEGAALCYQTICREALNLVGKNDHPRITLDSIAMARWLPAFDAGDFAGVARFMLESARLLAAAGADFAICPDNSAHLAWDDVQAATPIPWLHLTIDFEEVPATLGTVPAVSSKGFSLSNSVGIYVVSGPSDCSPECPGGSGHYAIAQASFPSGPVTLQRENGENFTLIAFDFGETNIGISYPPEIRVDGFTSSGDTVSFSVTLDGVNDGSGPLVDFQRAFLPASFRNLHSVRFTGTSRVTPDRFNYSLDNIQVGPALEPISVPTLSGTAPYLLALLLAIAGGVMLGDRAPL